MTTFSASVAVLCCSLLVASVIKLIAPTGKTEKILRLVISLFILICLTTCVKTIIDDIFVFKDNDGFYEEQREALDDSVNYNVLKVTGEYMVSYVESLLAVSGFDYEEVTVTVDSDKDGVINITDICIYLDNSNAGINNMSAIIENELKITPRMVVKN